MLKKNLFLGFILLLSSLTIACFSIDRRGGVLGVKHQTVETGFGKFQVGDLPEGWSRPKVKLKQLVYENDQLNATIVTDALCGPKFEDAPLRRLAVDLFAFPDKSGPVKIISERAMMIDGRKAYSIVGEGLMDGVKMLMEVVVLKKDFCLYDFVVFSEPSSFQKAQRDFKSYVSGFKSVRFR